jgi:hypothetical protein
VELGVAGDADAGSGPVLFSALGVGLDFSWSAGQEAAGATYTLGPTPYIGATGPERGFVYATVSEWADADSPIAIFWHGNLEPDGSHTSAFDWQGTFFNDPPGSTRAWLRYELVPVPEPSTLALAAFGALAPIVLLIAARILRFSGVCFYIFALVDRKGTTRIFSSLASAAPTCKSKGA